MKLYTSCTFTEFVLLLCTCIAIFTNIYYIIDSLLGDQIFFFKFLIIHRVTKYGQMDNLNFTIC